MMLTFGCLGRTFYVTQPPFSASPPPHILGQIVEMGFSVDQARQALAKISDGQDVQAALDVLLAEQLLPVARHPVQLPREEVPTK